MAVDPQCKAFLDQLAAMGGKPMHEMTPAELRAGGMPPEFGGPEQVMHRVEDREVPGPAGPVPIRVYVPAAAAQLPAIVFFHGGGFVLGNLDMSDRTCRQLAHQSGCVVISVDYRLAPEHKFPAAAEDAYAAARHVVEHAADFGIDAARVAVGGESSGANLATVTALMARERGGPSLAFQLLIYPVVDWDDDSPSLRDFAEGHFLTRSTMDYFKRLLFAAPQEARHPDASPLFARLGGLPPAFVITAECDPLRDQGEAYARKLQESGVPVTLKRYDGMIHPFFGLSGIIDGAKAAVADAAAALRRAVSAPAAARG